MIDSLDKQNILHEEELPFTKGTEFINDDNRFEIAQKRLDELKSFFSSVPPSAITAIKLHFFNFFLNDPEAPVFEVEQELEKMKILGAKEKEAYQKRNILPTIGIELEVPQNSVANNLIKICSKINLPADVDTVSVFEFSPEHSNSAAVQARILHDLEKLIKFSEKKGGQNLEEYAPLHINLGIPREFVDDITVEEEALLLSNLVSLAFVSPQRIKGEKWSPLYRIRTLLRNEKTEFSAIRLEIRAPSFEDKDDYRMLFEVQELAASMISFLKENSGVKVGKTEILLATLWSELKDEIEKFSEKYSKLFSHIVELKKENLKIESEVRSIFDKYAREASRIINLPTKNL
ncbi:MAG: hypothetical protein WCV55_01575 [Candidatus Paceibacterota bacterium]